MANIIPATGGTNELTQSAEEKALRPTVAQPGGLEGRMETPSSARSDGALADPYPTGVVDDYGILVTGNTEWHAMREGWKSSQPNCD